MKKLILSMSVGLLLLAGCSKENDSTQIEDQTGDLVWGLKFSDKNAKLEVISLDEFQTKQSEFQTKQSNSGAKATRGNSVHTHGDFAIGTFTFEWSGTENNGDTHGSAFVTQVLGGPFGTVPVELTMETECIMVEGNEAVYGGTFTKVENNPFPPGGPFEVGNHMYWKVTDNGQGNNAPPDQHYNSIFITPSFFSGCGVFTPSFPDWSPIFDVQEPGSVKVNN